MSEEKPTFKITDRRLFNPDGTPREFERAEETPAPAAEATAQTSAATEEPSAASSRSSSAAEERGASGAAARSRAGATHADADDAPSASARGEDARPSADPTPFINLVMFIASPAAAAMGMTEHPGMGREIDLPLAKHCIDLLATLRQKTSGNLSAQEDQILENLLGELRMQFVSLSGPRPGRPGGGSRGFTGSDITGGR